jgi:hypothetical protein
MVLLASVSVLPLLLIANYLHVHVHVSVPVAVPVAVIVVHHPGAKPDLPVFHAQGQFQPEIEISMDISIQTGTSIALGLCSWVLVPAEIPSYGATLDYCCSSFGVVDVHITYYCLSLLVMSMLYC